MKDAWFGKVVLIYRGVCRIQGDRTNNAGEW